MPKPRGLKTKTAAIAFLVLLNFLTITEPARAGATGRAAAGDGRRQDCGGCHEGRIEISRDCCERRAGCECRLGE